MTDHAAGGKKGALLGLAVGIAVLAGVFAFALACLPHRLSVLPRPWTCTDPVYGVVLFLAFPVNLLTDDLSRAVVFAPLSLAIYAAIGGLAASRSR